MTTPIFNPLNTSGGLQTRPFDNNVSFGDNPMFDFSTGEFYLDAGGNFAIRDDKTGLPNLIRKALMTERYFYPIYSTSYGSEIWVMFGKNFSNEEAKLDLRRVITDTLIYDPRILRVYDFNIIISEDKAVISFKYDDIWGKTQGIEFDY